MEEGGFATPSKPRGTLALGLALGAFVVASIVLGILFIIHSKPDVDGTTRNRPVIRVLAAASLGTPLREIVAMSSAVEVELSLAASSAHERQIASGADFDVFISAAPGPIERLGQQGFLDPVLAQVVAENELVAIVPRGASAPADLEALAKLDRIAVGAKGVPVGDYARQTLERAGLASAVESKLASYPDEPAVLTAVASGGAPAGFVYASSLVSHPSHEQVARAFVVDAKLHDPIGYTAAVSRRTKDQALARAFVEGFRNEAWRTKLRAAGFTIPRR